MEDVKIIIDQATKTLGFKPNSMIALAKKPNILGSFAMFFANVKGFANTDTSAWTGIKLMLKNMRWSLQAKKQSDKEVPGPLKDMIAHVTSNAAGCRYCQAHTAHSAHHSGVSIDKIKKLWEFESSELFDESEKAALSFAAAAGSVPNQVTHEHHARLKQHFTEEQVVEIVAYIAAFGFLNRWNDSMATQLEDQPFEFANEHLSEHWVAGKHRL